MGVLLALCSALAYGVADFVGGVVSRRTSAWSVAVVAQASSTACVALGAALVPGRPTAADLWWGLLAGVGSGTGTGFLYRGFASGRMSVVAPVSAVGAAVVPVLAGGVTGERPSAVVWVGVAAALPGIWLVSTSPPPADGPDGINRGTGLAEGLTDGVLAGLGFGLLFACLGQVSGAAGLWPLATCQAMSVVSVMALARALRAVWRPRHGPVVLAALPGVLGATATGLFLAATHHGYLTVAGVLASLYPAGTVLLAALVLRERVHRTQGVGLLLCAVAVALVATG